MLIYECKNDIFCTGHRDLNKYTLKVDEKVLMCGHKSNWLLILTIIYADINDLGR